MSDNKNSQTTVIYVRVSTGKQVDNYSLDAQTKILTEYAKMNHMTVIKIFREEGKSARYTDNRPVYQEMMQYLKKHHVDIVLTHKLDRMYRSEYDTYAGIRQFKKLGIRYLAIADGIDSENRESSLSIAIQAALSSNFSRNLSKETRKGLLAGAENCQHMGGKPPYGFQIHPDSGLLEIDETTAPAVRKIFELYADGFSSGEICKWLKKNGYKTANGNDFTANSLNSILKNEKYHGYYTWDKAAPKDEDGHRNSHAMKDHYIRIKNGCPAIVTDEVFASAQKRLIINRKKASRAKPKRYYPLNGRIWCAECGAGMTGNVQYSAGHRYYMYRCSKRCGCKAINAQVIEKSVLEALEKSLFSVPNQEAILSSMNHMADDRKSATDKTYQQLKSKISGMETAQNNLMEALAFGKATSVIMNRLDRISNEIDQVKNKLANLDRSKYTFRAEDLYELQDSFTSYMMSTGSINAKKLIMNTIKRVDVSNSSIHVILSDGISIDKQTKNLFQKEENIMNKNINLDAILASVEMKDNQNISCKFVVRTPSQLNFDGNCVLTIPEVQLYKFAQENECDFFELIGSTYRMAVEMNEKGAITKMLGLTKVAA